MWMNVSCELNHKKSEIIPELLQQILVIYMKNMNVSCEYYALLLF